MQYVVNFKLHTKFSYEKVKINFDLGMLYIILLIFILYLFSFSFILVWGLDLLGPVVTCFNNTLKDAC